MVLEWIALGIGILTVILLAVVLRLVTKAAAPTVERLERRTEAIEAALAQVGRMAVTLDERTRAIPQVSNLVTSIDRQTQSISASVPAISAVEARTRTISEAAGRIPAIEARLGQVDQIRLGLEDLAGKLRSDRKFGKVGEEAVESILTTFPDDTWRAQFVLGGGGRVDFAFILPNGKIAPIDSKTGGSEAVHEIAKTLEMLDTLEPGHPDRPGLIERNRKLVGDLHTIIVREASGIGDYVKSDDRCLNVALMAVPDPLFDLISPRTRQASLEYNVELVPYSLLVAFLHYLRRQNLYGTTELESVQASLGKAQQSLVSIEETLTNSVERASTMLDNAARRIRSELEIAQRLLRGAEVDL